MLSKDEDCKPVAKALRESLAEQTARGAMARAATAGSLSGPTMRSDGSSSHVGSSAVPARNSGRSTRLRAGPKRVDLSDEAVRAGKRVHICLEDDLAVDLISDDDSVASSVVSTAMVAAAGAPGVATTAAVGAAAGAAALGSRAVVVGPNWSVVKLMEKLCQARLSPEALHQVQL